MSTLNVNIPDSLMKKLQELAARDGISPNEFISSAVAEKIASFLTEEYLRQRGQAANREAFDQALSKVPGLPAQPGDEL